MGADRSLPDVRIQTYTFTHTRTRRSSLESGDFPGHRVHERVKYSDWRQTNTGCQLKSNQGKSKTVADDRKLISVH